MQYLLKCCTIFLQYLCNICTIFTIFAKKRKYSYNIRIIYAQYLHNKLTIFSKEKLCKICTIFVEYSKKSKLSWGGGQEIYRLFAQLGTLFLKASLIKNTVPSLSETPPNICALCGQYLFSLYAQKTMDGFCYKSSL